MHARSTLDALRLVHPARPTEPERTIGVVAVCAPSSSSGSRRASGLLALSVVALSLILLAPAGAASAAPPNDDFGDAKPLRLGKNVRGNINGATKQRGEPQHASSLATRSVWYRFRAKRKVTVLLGTCQSNFDSVVAVYTGRRLSGLREVDFNNDGCGRTGAGSRVSFTARRGRTYRIAVVGFTASGRFTLTAERIFTPPNDDFADAVRVGLGQQLSASTRGATRELREPGHTDNAPHTVWFKVSVATQSPVHLRACNRSTPSLTVYTGSRVSALTRVTGGGCDVTFTAQPGVTYRVVAEDFGAGGGFRLDS